MTPTPSEPGSPEPAARGAGDPSEQMPCYLCGKPSRFTVREEDSPQTYRLCVADYRLALVLADLVKARLA